MWTKIDDKYPDHPKIIQVGPLAAWLHTCALTYCSRYLTDGFIPAKAVRKLVDWDGIGIKQGEAWGEVDNNALVTALVTAGLWVESQDGYTIHDYLEYNPSAEDVKEERQKAAERQANWRKRNTKRPTDKSNAVTKDVTSPVDNAVSSPSPYPYPLTISPQAKRGRAKPNDTEPDAEYQPVFDALAKLTGLDPALKAPTLGKTATRLRAAHYTAAHVAELGKWWKLNDWRGKRGQAPTLPQVEEAIGKVKVTSPPKIVDDYEADPTLKDLREARLGVVV